MLHLPEKGNYGYMRQKKKIELTKTIFHFLIVLIIYMTGWIIYHNNKSIYTVMAGVAVLPAAKALTGYLMIASYPRLARERYEEVMTAISGCPSSSVLCDILLSSPEKSMRSEMIVLLGGNILMFSDTSVKNPAATETYMKKILENCNYTSVKMYTDYQQFFNRIKNLAGNLSSKEISETMTNRIKKQIFTYSF